MATKKIVSYNSINDWTKESLFEVYRNTGTVIDEEDIGDPNGLYLNTFINSRLKNGCVVTKYDNNYVQIYFDSEDTDILTYLPTKLPRICNKNFYFLANLKSFTTDIQTAEQVNGMYRIRFSLLRQPLGGVDTVSNNWPYTGYNNDTENISIEIGGDYIKFANADDKYKVTLKSPIRNNKKYYCTISTTSQSITFTMKDLATGDEYTLDSDTTLVEQADKDEIAGIMASNKEFYFAVGMKKFPQVRGLLTTSAETYKILNNTGLEIYSKNAATSEDEMTQGDPNFTYRWSKYYTKYYKDSVTTSVSDSITYPIDVTKIDSYNTLSSKLAYYNSTKNCIVMSKDTFTGTDNNEHVYSNILIKKFPKQVPLSMKFCVGIGTAYHNYLGNVTNGNFFVFITNSAHIDETNPKGIVIGKTFNHGSPAGSILYVSADTFDTKTYDQIVNTGTMLAASSYDSSLSNTSISVIMQLDISSTELSVATSLASNRNATDVDTNTKLTVHSTKNSLLAEILSSPSIYIGFVQYECNSTVTIEPMLDISDVNSINGRYSYLYSILKCDISETGEQEEYDISTTQIIEHTESKENINHQHSDKMGYFEGNISGLYMPWFQSSEHEVELKEQEMSLCSVGVADSNTSPNYILDNMLIYSTESTLPTKNFSVVSKVVFDKDSINNARQNVGLSSISSSNVPTTNYYEKYSSYCFCLGVIPVNSLEEDVYNRYYALYVRRSKNELALESQLLGNQPTGGNKTDAYIGNINTFTIAKLNNKDSSWTDANSYFYISITRNGNTLTATSSVRSTSAQQSDTSLSISFDLSTITSKVTDSIEKSYLSSIVNCYEPFGFCTKLMECVNIFISSDNLFPEADEPGQPADLLPTGDIPLINQPTILVNPAAWDPNNYDPYYKITAIDEGKSIHWEELSTDLQNRFKDLSNRILNEKNTRIAEDNKLKNKIAQEAKDRAAADSAIEALINAALNNLKSKVADTSKYIEENSKKDLRLQYCFTNGRDGQVLKVDLINKSLYPHDIFYMGKFATNKAELDAMQAIPVVSSAKEIFNKWYCFAHFDYDALVPFATPIGESSTFIRNGVKTWQNLQYTGSDMWKYDETANTVIKYVDWSPFCGYVTPASESHYEYYIKTKVSYTDDDVVMIVAGFMTDSNGKEHSLSICRWGAYNAGPDGNYGKHSWMLVYDFGNPTQHIIDDESETTPSGGTGHLYISAKKSGTYYTFKTSDINGSDVNDKYTIAWSYPSARPSSMTQEEYDNIGVMVNTQCRVGFGAFSMTATFLIEEQDGLFEDQTHIYSLYDDKLWTYINGTWTQNGRVHDSLSNFIWLYNNYNNRFYFYSYWNKYQRLNF